MTNEPFGRQPKPVTILIIDGDHIDRCDMQNMLYKYLRNRIDMIEQSGRPEMQILRCYSRAVND